ncbi:hypothetical protein [Yoonia vestfoldensis]|uniref:hypothetical protein n=1 Tax=Yoonia vestfoldensis TaxID=245188 RepID=UPI000372C76F|nr:hypothetical protein [Yoonia vestfoldensis]
MNYRHIGTAAMIAYHGLHTAHNAANQLGKGEDKPDMARAAELLSMRFLFFRHIMLEIANIADLAGISRALYKDHPDLGKMNIELKESFSFFKYIRNKYIGHLDSDLTDKTFEWEPTANVTFGKLDAGKQFMLSWFILETVINTYSDPKTGHKIFETETALSYPPDEKRFFDYLGNTAEKSLKYSKRLIEVSASYVDLPDMKNEWVELSIKAGQTEFSYLNSKKR